MTDLEIFLTRLWQSSVIYNIYCSVSRILLLYLFGTPPIYVIGDSHVLSFVHPNFKYFHLGPATAYGLSNPNSKTQSLNKLNKILFKLSHVPKANILLVFGEIDCRIHIYTKYMKLNKKISISKIIKTAILHYIHIINQCHKKGYMVNVLCVVPPGSQNNIYKLPYYAPWSLRLKITKEFNRMLKVYCYKYNINYIDVFNQFSDISGHPLPQYLFDNVHLNYKICPIIYNRIIK